MKNKNKPVKGICAVVSGVLVLFVLAGLACSGKRSFR